MTKENVRMLHAHFKKIEENGSIKYPAKLQAAVKGKAKLHRMEIEAARPWLLEETKPKTQTDSKPTSPTDSKPITNKGAK